MAKLTHVRNVAAAFLAQNVAMGFGFGSFGPLLAANRHHFDVSSTVAVFGMSVITLALGVLSPVAGRFMNGMRIKNVLLAGVACSCIGYAMLAVVPEFAVALIAYVLIGAGICLTAILGPMTLITRSFAKNRAKMLGIVNLPVVLFACPFLVAWGLSTFGREAVLLVMAGVFVVLAPILHGLVSEPQSEIAGAGQAAPSETSTVSLLAKPAFWLVSLGIGLMAGVGTGFMVHLVPLGMSGGLSLSSASALMSVYAGAGLLGTPLFGWLADKITPAGALVLNVSIQAALCVALTGFSGAPLFLIAGLLGLCCNPTTTLHGAAMGATLGPSVFSQAMGLSFLIKLPFLFAIAPVMAVLFDRTGGYEIPFMATSAALVAAAALFFLLTRLEKTRPRVPEILAVG